MNTDTELETWRQVWRDQSEPLPALKKKIRRQNLRMAAGVAAICVCLALSTMAAVRTRSWFIAGLATGIGFASLFLGSYAWWVRRGAWKPTAQTTLAYAELSYKRVIAKSRTLRFSFYFMFATVLLFTVFVAWNWKTLGVREGIIVAAMVAELFFLKRCGRRKEQEIKETKKLIDDMQE